jgi:hypothetical protein
LRDEKLGLAVRHVQSFGVRKSGGVNNSTSRKEKPRIRPGVFIVVNAFLKR